jgi:hypothetical protein
MNAMADKVLQFPPGGKYISAERGGFLELVADIEAAGEALERIRRNRVIAELPTAEAAILDAEGKLNAAIACVLVLALETTLGECETEEE